MTKNERISRLEDKQIAAAQSATVSDVDIHKLEVHLGLVAGGAGDRIKRLEEWRARSTNHHVWKVEAIEKIQALLDIGPHRAGKLAHHEARISDNRTELNLHEGSIQAMKNRLSSLEGDKNPAHTESLLDLATRITKMEGAVNTLNARLAAADTVPEAIEPIGTAPPRLFFIGDEDVGNHPPLGMYDAIAKDMRESSSCVLDGGRGKFIVLTYAKYKRSKKANIQNGRDKEKEDILKLIRYHVDVYAADADGGVIRSIKENEQRPPKKD